MRPALVCGITADLDFALANLLIGFQRHNPDFAGDVVVFHDGLSAAQQQLLASLGLPLVFRPYDHGRMMRRLGLPDSGETRARLAGIVQRYSPLMLAKLELPDLLAEYTHAVWMDADMLVRAAVPDLFSFDAMAWRPLPPGWEKRRGALLGQCADLWRHRDTPFPNGGLLGLARGAGKVDLYAMARRILERLDFQSLDEAAWFLTAAETGITVTPWPMGYNHPVTRAGVEAAQIVHAIGPQKFWNAAALVGAFPDWEHNQSVWRKLGGGGWSGPIAQSQVEPLSLPERIKASACRDYWLGIYDAMRDTWPEGLLPDLRSQHRDWRLWIAGQGARAHIVLGMLPNPRRVSVTLAVSATPSELPAVISGLEPGLSRLGDAYELQPVAGGLEYSAVVPVAKLHRHLTLLRDAALKLSPMRAKSGAETGG